MGKRQFGKALVLAVMALVLVFSAGCYCLKDCRRASAFQVDRNFGSHMVLQREVPICISGEAEKNTVVQVVLADESGKVVRDCLAACGLDGRWQAKMKALPAGGPYTLSVKGNEEAEPIVLEDVMIGEVWICSGQSNMEMPVYSGYSAWGDERYEEILAEAESGQYPLLRLFNESLVKDLSPAAQRSQPKGQWTKADRDNVALFSATAYNFGTQLSRDLRGVPIGLINVSWSGTRIEPWISWQGYESANRPWETAMNDWARASDEDRPARLEELQKTHLKARLKWMVDFQKALPPESKEAEEWRKPEYSDEDWPEYDTDLVFIPSGITGVGWARKVIEIPEDWQGRDLTVYLHFVDDIDWTYANGQLVGQTLVDKDYYWGVERKYTIPGSAVNSTRLTLAVRLADLYGTGGLPATAEQRYVSLADDETQRVDISRGWRFRMECPMDIEKLGGLPNDACPTANELYSPQFPSTLYNSLIHPWVKYPVRGVIWYQGCSNAERATDYLTLQKLLIKDWRRAWHNDKLAFIITQLSGFGPRAGGQPGDWQKDIPGASYYGALREAQYLAMKQTPRTGLAVTIDHGDENDIHPHNKTVVGFRLAREAGRLCYGRRDITAGPYFRRVKFAGNQAIVSFDNIGDGLAASDNDQGRLNGFILAGEDGVFHHAEAVIKGTQVIVTSAEVDRPVAVRYAWVSYAGNLNFININGFPACPFRSDR